MQNRGWRGRGAETPLTRKRTGRCGTPAPQQGPRGCPGNSCHQGPAGGSRTPWSGPPDAHGTRDTNTSEAVGVRGRGAVGTAAHGRTHDPARERGRHPAAARGGADTSHRVRKPEIQVFTGNLIFKSDIKKKKKIGWAKRNLTGRPVPWQRPCCPERWLKRGLSIAPALGEGVTLKGTGTPDQPREDWLMLLSRSRDSRW